jgi:tetratricopeptide (TPR) repeat protein
LEIFNLKKKRAQKLHAKAQQLSDEGYDSEALELYFQAITLDPEKSESYYNIGLIYKYRGEWELSLKYNKLANDLCPEDEAARWNLAIAATALRNWDIARAAWIQNGIRLDGESGPIEMNFGITPVRLNPNDAGEVVWATRIDPVRARIDSIPFIESGFRHGDIVLHDGAPVGQRQIDGREYPVFNALQIFEQSDYQTVRAEVELTKDEDLQVLEELLSKGSHVLEDWTANIRMLCKQCSEGIPHEHHHGEPPANWVSERKFGIAIYGGGSISSLLDAWQSQTGSRLISLTA